MNIDFVAGSAKDSFRDFFNYKSMFLMSCPGTRKYKLVYENDINYKIISQALRLYKINYLSHLLLSVQIRTGLSFLSFPKVLQVKYP